MPGLGRVFNDAEASDDKGPQEQQEPSAREDREDFATDAPRGDCEALEEGFFLAVSPRTWRSSALRIAFQS